MQRETTKEELLKKVARVPLGLLCPAAEAHEAAAMADGFVKYGFASFLDDNVEITAVECLSAARRHINRLLSGEDYAPDSKVHHAGHARAMLGIYLECMEAGKLVDDRHGGVGKRLDDDGRNYVGRLFDKMGRDNLEKAKKLLKGTVTFGGLTGPNK